jgi:hypothetical protein
MSHKVWNAASFLNLPVLKVSTNGKKINSVETRCLASSPRQVSNLIIYSINRRSNNLLFIQFGFILEQIPLVSRKLKEFGIKMFAKSS